MASSWEASMVAEYDESKVMSAGCSGGVSRRKQEWDSLDFCLQPVKGI